MNISTILTTTLAVGITGPLAAQDAKTKAKPAPLGCTSCDLVGTDTNSKARLKIRWKRRVVAAKKGAAKTTAPCHAGTEKALDAAFASLKKSLAPLGVQVELQKAALSDAQFAKDARRSNRIWINGVALSMYLPGAKVGTVRDAKTQVAMRTIEFGGKSFRDVPAQLIVAAGLVAAADSVKQALAEAHAVGCAGGKKSCCDAPPAAGKSCCDTKPEPGAKTGGKSGCCEPPPPPAAGSVKTGKTKTGTPESKTR